MANVTRWTPVMLLLTVACAHDQQAAPPAATAPAVAETPPAPPPQPPPPAKKDDEELTRLISQPISHFDFDKALLRPDDHRQLQALAAALKASPSARIQIAGNCDERGTEEYNLHLGQRRAAVARSYLTKLGIDGVRLDTISYGEDRPLDPGHNEQAWAANRRDDATRLPDLAPH